MASFKKILKLVMVLGLVIFAYAGYIIFSESDPVELIDELEDSATEMVEESNKNIQLETAAKGKTERIMEKFEREEKDIMSKFEKQEKEIIEKFNIPFYTSFQSKGIIPYDHYLNCGVLSNIL